MKDKVKEITEDHLVQRTKKKVICHSTHIKSLFSPPIRLSLLFELVSWYEIRGYGAVQPQSCLHAKLTEMGKPHLEG